MTWVFCAEPLVLTWATTEAIQATVSRSDLHQFALFVVCGLAHAYGTRKSEEHRRGTHGNGTHVDQTSIWFFSAALVLPVPLVLALIAIIRIQRWLIARKPFYKWMHTNFAIALSALSVHEVATAAPLRAWLTGERTLSPAEASAWMIAAISAYFLAQAIMVGAVRALAHTFPYGGGEPDTDDSLLVDALGTWKDNGEIAFALLLAAAAAVLHALAAPLLALMIPIAITTTWGAQRIGSLEGEVRQLTKDATHDANTGLLNRLGFEPAATQALALNERMGHTTALLLLDLDRFKRINDTLGHIAGDQVLVAFAGAVRGAVRESDLACRWGGEEFIVLMPETDPTQALVLAERIRRDIEALKIPVTKAAGGDTIILGAQGPGDRSGCTVSIGMACSPHHGTELGDLIKLADLAMYRAKEGGRNQVKVADPTWPRDTSELPGDALPGMDQSFPESANV
ncbi:GGDEF domain-containing protein [Actinokineospora sp. HUAS TT18]|uniref:GGDEF domain-containing protein n=1 Tax=Actinokineospora sp. HUAS TT18 TaxID=3447451 RepID=UPI003F5205C1